VLQPVAPPHATHAVVPVFQKKPVKQVEGREYVVNDSGAIHFP